MAIFAGLAVGAALAGAWDSFAACLVLVCSAAFVDEEDVA